MTNANRPPENPGNDPTPPPFVTAGYDEGALGDTQYGLPTGAIAPEIRLQPAGPEDTADDSGRVDLFDGEQPDIPAGRVPSGHLYDGRIDDPDFGAPRYTAPLGPEDFPEEDDERGPAPAPAPARNDVDELDVPDFLRGTSGDPEGLARVQRAHQTSADTSTGGGELFDGEADQDTDTTTNSGDDGVFVLPARVPGDSGHAPSGSTPSARPAIPRYSSPYGGYSPATPAPAPAPAPAPRTTGDTSGSTPTPRSEREARLHDLLTHAQNSATAEQNVHEVLRQGTEIARDQYAGLLAKAHTSSNMKPGAKRQLLEAQRAYYEAVDAEGIAAIDVLLADREYTDMRTEEEFIRECSVMGNLGFERTNSDGSTEMVPGEEHNLVQSLAIQAMGRAGYKVLKEEHGPDGAKYQVVSGYEVPDSKIARARLAAYSAWERMGTTRKGKVARIAVIGMAGAGLGLIAGMTGGAGAAAVVAAGSTRLAKSGFGLMMNRGAQRLSRGEQFALDAERGSAEIGSPIAARRDASVYQHSFEGVASEYANDAMADSRQNRKRAAIAGASALIGYAAAEGLQHAWDWMTGGSNTGAASSGGKAPTPGASHVEPTPTETGGASPEPTPTHTGSAEPTPTHTGGSGSPETGNGNTGTGTGEQHQPGSNSGEQADRQGGTADTTPGNTNPDATKIEPGRHDTVYGDFSNAGIGFDKVATAADKLVANGDLGKHLINGDPSQYYYTGGSQAEIEKMIFDQMVRDGAIDASDYDLTA